VTTIYRSEAGKQAVERLYRETLRRWPVPNRQLTVPTRQGDTFVVVSGERKETPVVLLHGSGTNSSVWMRDVAEWARGSRTRDTSSASIRFVTNDERRRGLLRPQRHNRIDARGTSRRQPHSRQRDSAEQQRHADEDQRIARGDAKQE
jgi:hypothetical protein